MTKAWAPGWWEVSGGACAGRRSHPDEAVQREVKEETGSGCAQGGRRISVLLIREKTRAKGDNYFVDVYRFVMDIDENDVSFQEAEIDGYMFATKEQIEGFAAEGKFLHYDSIKQAFSFEK
ncbi:MAG: NUDIX domain-containing protein [Anaerobutyricum soehngenii]